MAIPIGPLTFTTATDQALEAFDSRWTKISASEIQVSEGSDKIISNGANVLYRWNADTFGGDQFVSWVATGAGLGVSLYSNFGGAVRVDGSGNGYAFVCGGGDPDTGTTNGAAFIKIATTTTRTLLGAQIADPTSGQTVKLSISGSTLSVYYDDVLQTTRTDSSYASGNVGLAGTGATANQIIDDVYADNLAAAPASNPLVGKLGYPLRGKI